MNDIACRHNLLLLQCNCFSNSYLDMNEFNSVYLIVVIISISVVSNQGCSYRMGCEKCISYGHTFYVSCFQPGVLIPHGV